MRSLSLLLVFSALLGLALPVQAAEPTPDLVITGAAAEDHAAVPWLHYQPEVLVQLQPAPDASPATFVALPRLAHRPRLASPKSGSSGLALASPPVPSARAGPLSHETLSPPLHRV